jgi:hypothetical protein
LQYLFVLGHPARRHEIVLGPPVLGRSGPVLACLSRNGNGGSSVMLPRARSGCHSEPASSHKCSGQIRDDTELTPARSGPPCSGPGPGTVRFRKKNACQLEALRLLRNLCVLDSFQKLMFYVDGSTPFEESWRFAYMGAPFLQAAGPSISQGRRIDERFTCTRGYFFLAAWLAFGSGCPAGLGKG